ncbi:MAG: 2-amino-4-hydroxy-6-hydroxymethyldihydropteridine diphosphokinase, partial [Zetaproteobacteria bacterium]
HWGPRTIDLDLWLVEDEVRDTPRLMLPHPRLAERRFALAPLAALWPSWRHPLLGQTALEMLAACPEPSAHIRALGGW